MNFKRIAAIAALVIFCAGVSVVGGFLSSAFQMEMARQSLINAKTNARFNTVRVEGEHTRGSGVIIQPSDKGLTQVLTNGHICDGLEVFPKDDKYLKMTLEQSLYLPVKGQVIFDGGAKAKVNRIVKHTDTPDLCVIEVQDTNYTHDYAKLAERGPDYEEPVFTMGFPGGENKIAFNGEFQGPETSTYPARTISPNIRKQLLALEAEGNKKLKEMMELTFGMIFADPEEMTPDMRKEMKEKLDGLKKDLDKIAKKMEKLYISSQPRLEYRFSNLCFPGSSGSGVWNEQGELVAVIWGMELGNQTVIAVPYPVLKSWLGTLPTK